MGRPTITFEANHLLSWRTEHGLSLRELSELTGLTPAMLNKVERREARLAPLTRVTVARRLGCRISDLFPVEQVTVDPNADEGPGRSEDA